MNIGSRPKAVKQVENGPGVVMPWRGSEFPRLFSSAGVWAALLITACFRLDSYFKCASIVAEIAFVDAEKQHAIALRDEIATAADENEFIVVVADHRDQAAGRRTTHQLFAIRNVGQAVRRRETIAAEADAAAGGDS